MKGETMIARFFVAVGVLILLVFATVGCATRITMDAALGMNPSIDSQGSTSTSGNGRRRSAEGY